MGETGEGNQGRGDRKEWEEGKVKDPPTNISPTSKHSDCSPALKNFFLLSLSPPPPFPPSFLIILDKRLVHHYIMYTYIESQTQFHKNYSYKPELEMGRADPPTWMSVTHSTSRIRFLTLLPMEAIFPSLTKHPQIMFSLIQKVLIMECSHILKTALLILSIIPW